MHSFTKYAMEIAENAPLSVTAAKVTVNELIKTPEDRDVAACEAAVEACYLSNDYVEGQKPSVKNGLQNSRGQ